MGSPNLRHRVELNAKYDLNDRGRIEIRQICWPLGKRQAFGFGQWLSAWKYQCLASAARLKLW